MFGLKFLLSFFSLFLSVGAFAFFPPDKATQEALGQLRPTERGEEFLKAEIESMKEWGVSLTSKTEPWTIKYTVVDELPGGNLAQIVPEFIAGTENLTVHLRITKEGIKNPAVVMEEIVHLLQITGLYLPWMKDPRLQNFAVRPLHWSEIVANARAGSLSATEKLARTEVEALERAKDAVEHYRTRGLFSDSSESIEKYLKARTAHAEKLHHEVAKAAKVQNREKKAAHERAKSVFAELEKNEVKLNDLVARGDRQGVRKLVETYLPWNLMEPSETKVWKEWLESIEKPNGENMKLVFRGMGDDVVLKSAEGKPYLMSTVLTKNQGNYNRRLRSLTTMRERIGVEDLPYGKSVHPGGKADKTGAVSALMYNHSMEPKGSPFLSSSNYREAIRHGYQRIGAFTIDERRLVLNALANYVDERELLTPLFIFPDEVVYVHDYVKNPVPGMENVKDPSVVLGQDRQEHFILAVEERLNRKVTPAEIGGEGTDMEFSRKGISQFKEGVWDKVEAVGPSCGLGKVKACECLFQSLSALLK